MKAEKFEEFTAHFNVAQYPLPLLLAEKIGQTEPDNVFKTVPVNKSAVTLSFQGRKPGTRPLDNAVVFNFQLFEKSARIGISVGRVDNCKVCLPDSAVSKMHASFKLNAQGAWELADVDSTNNTRINGLEISSNKAITLKNSDGITFADVYHCTFFTPEGFQSYLKSIGK